MQTEERKLNLHSCLSLLLSLLASEVAAEFLKAFTREVTAQLDHAKLNI